MRALPCVVSLFLAALLPAQNVSLTVTSSIGSAGPICGPWNCVPDPVSANQGETLLLRAGAGFTNPVFLLASLPSTQCVNIPGFGGSLIVSNQIVAVPIVPNSFSNLNITFPPGVPVPPCATKAQHDTLTLPTGVPPGSTIVLQTITCPPFVTPLSGMFSNAVAVTVL